jgi:hypothetical protein
MGFRLYLTLNDDLTKRALIQADKEKLDMKQIITKVLIQYLKETESIKGAKK